MPSAFTNYANYHFTVNNGGIRKKRDISKIRPKFFVIYYFSEMTIFLYRTSIPIT